MVPGAAPILSRVAAIMLAGGQGSRLFELTEQECKPAVRFAGGRRIVDWTMANLSGSGLTDLIVATQYRPDTLHRHLQRYWRPAFRQIEIRCGADGAPYRGTADAVARNIDAIDAQSPTEVVVVAADHIYRMDLGQMIAAHRASGARVTVAADIVPRAEARPFGVMHIRGDNRILDFVEKPADPPAMPGEPDKSLVSMGIYVFSWRWLRSILPGAMEAAGSRQDFGHDILPAAVAQGEAAAFPVRKGPAGGRFYWRDVGTLDAYRRTWLELEEGVSDCPVPVYPAEADAGPCTLPHVQRLGSGTPLRRFRDRSNVLLGGTQIPQSARLERAIVASGAVIPPGLVVGEDPEADARWFRVTPGGTTLITPAMLSRRSAMRAVRSWPARDAHRALRKLDRRA